MLRDQQDALGRAGWSSATDRRPVKKKKVQKKSSHVQPAKKVIWAMGSGQPILARLDCFCFCGDIFRGDSFLFVVTPPTHVDGTPMHSLRKFLVMTDFVFVVSVFIA